MLTVIMIEFRVTTSKTSVCSWNNIKLFVPVRNIKYGETILIFIFLRSTPTTYLSDHYMWNMPSRLPFLGPNVFFILKVGVSFETISRED